MTNSNFKNVAFAFSTCIDAQLIPINERLVVSTVFCLKLLIAIILL